MVTYPPSAKSIADLLAWGGRTGAGLTPYTTDDPLLHTWQWAFQDWQNATLSLRNLLFAGGAMQIINKTGGSIGPCPVAIGGYDAASGLLTVIPADSSAANKAADGWLLSAVANNATGVLVWTGSLLTAALNTSASTIGNPVYLTTAGGLSLTSNAGAFTQIVGQVETLANPGTISVFVRVPQLQATNAANGLMQLDANGRLANANNLLNPPITKSANYTALATDEIILVDSTAGVVNIALPSAVGLAGKKYTIKDWQGQAATNNITATPNGAQKIDNLSGPTTLSTNFAVLRIVSDGANWVGI